MSDNAECRIYAACLASYNNGRLHGAWIDCDGKDAGDIWAEINAMLATSPYPNVIRRKCEECGAYFDISGERGDVSECPNCGSSDVSAKFDSAEEFAIHDHEGFGELIGENTGVATVAALAGILAGGDADAITGLHWLIKDRGYSISDAIEECGDVRTYSSDAWDLAADYAQELAADCCDMKHADSWPYTCIDWKQAARELLIGGDIDEFDGPDGRVIITNANEF